MDQKAISECLKFINSYWDKIVCPAEASHKNSQIIPLPHTFITPNTSETSHWGGAMFYWDSFFILRGFIGTKKESIIFSMVDNFIYLFEKYGIIPNANFWGFLGHSQPPLLSSMIFDAYYSLERPTSFKNLIRKINAKYWLKKKINFAINEYWTVWEDEKKYNHKVKDFDLSKYGDRDVGYNLNAERESGWDFTTRFYNRCNEFLPIDLNSFLFKYETDFLRFSEIFKNKNGMDFWQGRINQRKLQINKYMWNEKKGFFFDYDYKNNIQSDFYSLAGFVPMWAKLATYKQALKIKENLKFFETENGLTITSKISSSPKLKLDYIPIEYRYSMEEILKQKQWDYPNIWSPSEYLTVIGLLRYGFIDDAKRIMEKSINANLKVFKKYKQLLEKMDGETGDKPKTYWYPTQLGFGWSNAIFYRYTKILEHLKETNDNIYSDKDKLNEPPYSITTLLH